MASLTRGRLAAFSEMAQASSRSRMTASAASVKAFFHPPRMVGRREQERSEHRHANSYSRARGRRWNPLAGAGPVSVSPSASASFVVNVRLYVQYGPSWRLSTRGVYHPPFLPIRCVPHLLPRLPSPTPARSPADAIPLYVALAKTLAGDIEGGRYAIGSTLPTEGELAQRYGVSRHTVRQALRELKEEGLLWSRPGIGTKVRARPESPRFFSGIHTISDLLQFVDATEMHVKSRREIVADASRRTAALRAGPGLVGNQHRAQSAGRRHARCAICKPICVPSTRAPSGRARVIKRPIYSLVEERYGVRIVEVLRKNHRRAIDAGNGAYP